MAAVNLHINTIVTVHLTPEGAVVYNTYYGALPGRMRPAEKHAGDSLEVVMWELMAIFGPATYHGGPNMFMPNTINFNT